MAGTIAGGQHSVLRSSSCREQLRDSVRPVRSSCLRRICGVSSSGPRPQLAGGIRTLPTPSRPTVVRADRWGRKVESGAQEAKDQGYAKAQEAGRKIEGGAQEAQDEAPQKAQEAKGAASRAGQEAQQQYEDPTERSKFIAEFSAMALFTFLTCTASAAAVSTAGSATQALLWRMGTYSIIFPLIVFIFAPISKAHFNPMVTISMVVAGQQSLANGINYIIAQCLGAILGAALALWSLPGSQQNASYLGAAAIPAGRSVAQAFLGELIGGAIFIYVLFATIVDPRGWGKLGPLSLGLTVPLLMWAVGPISSLSINPARAFGLSVVAGGWQHHWVWWAASILGGALAGKIYSDLFLPTAKEA